MDKSFYNSKSYKEKQSAKAKTAWQLRLRDFKYKRDKRVCARESCGIVFEIAPGLKNKYCSQSCSAKTSNSNRVHSKSTKNKIAKAMTGIVGASKGKILVPRLEKLCKYKECKKMFLSERWKKQVYCSNKCAMKVVGGRPTSPKASRGKAGIRQDVSKTAYFHSRWEANIARLYNYKKIKWEYEPKTFDIGGQMYTPDFYIPDSDTYVEIKNFWGQYSKKRDTKFREAYPDIKLQVILKKEYLELQEKYATKIKKWEYHNSEFK